MKLDVSDPGHRLIIETSRSLGIPPSVFLGRRIRSVIEEHDGVRSLVQEELWTDDDRAAILDLAEWEAGLCPSCKHPLAETTGVDYEERWVAEVAGICQRCVAIEQRQEASQDHPHTSALLMSVGLRDATAG